MTDSNGLAVMPKTLEDKLDGEPDDVDYRAEVAYFPTARSKRPIIRREYHVKGVADDQAASEAAYRRLKDAVKHRVPDQPAPTYENGVRDGRMVFEDGSYVQVSTSRL